ncbi:uncharacterized protein KIAA0825-like [Gigantopelta aegis]|uniref:uncharacterized protein KIAA0825-like n=1 Tax=Gigantopelta aegis TaxID=1735272 RepID=UPI001B88DAEF|nr:uncharacterized protein KIAA0825-like [Gigantopelta aegis]
MAASRLSMDDVHQLPPFNMLLKDGTSPGPAVLDLYLHDLDSQLEENTKELDNCLKSILKFTNDLPGSKDFSTPKEGLAHMLNSHVLEKDSCYDPEIEDVTAMLSYLYKTLEQCPGSEEAVLQEILSLSSDEGLLLPLRNSGIDPTVMSMASINMVVDSSDQVIEQKWNRIAEHLKKHFVSRLSQLPLTKSDDPSNVVTSQRLHFLQSLRVIATDEDAWHCYRGVRTQELQKQLSEMVAETEQVNYLLSRHCSAMADLISSMIDEDFLVLNTGMFTKVTNVFKSLHDLYLEKYSDEMTLLVEEISDEIADAKSKSFSQSQSELGISVNSAVSLLKGQAQSLDSMIAIAGVRGNSLHSNQGPQEGSLLSNMAMPKACVDSLLEIVLSFLHIENHIFTLLKNSSWNVAGISGQKKKRKGSLRGVLKPSSSPELERHSVNLGSQSNSDTNINVSSTPSLASLIGNITPTPRVIERMKTEDRLHWDWRLIFKKISSDLSRIAEDMLHMLMKNGLHCEIIEWEKSNSVETRPVDKLLHGGKLDYPKVVSKAVLDFFDEATRLLPLAHAGNDGCLHSVKMVFVDTVSLAIKNFNMHFTKLSKDIPSLAPVSCLYVFLSSVVYIRNHLVHYEKLLFQEEGGKRPFAILHKQSVELIDAFTKQIVELHKQLVSTSVLHDAEGNNWADPKDFYEDERCSFTIQMWNYHLRSLQFDLWSVCPPRLAQSIFSSVLHDSLLVITQRYVRVKPSYRRVKQFRYDLTTVLLSTEEFLFDACDSISKLLDPGHSDLPHYSIHNLCSTLFSCLAVVSSPIDVLCRVFKRGYGRRRESDDHFSLHLETSYHGSNTQWLCWIRPALFQLTQKHYEDMQTTVALYLQIRLLFRQPETDWGKLMQALIMKEYTLPILLLTRSMDVIHQMNDISNQSEAVIHKSSRSGSQSGAVVKKVVPPVDKHRRETAVEVCSVLVRILKQCRQFPDALAKTLMPVIRTEELDLLDLKSGAAPDVQPPLWIELIFKILEPSIQSILEPVLEYLIGLPTATAELDPLITKIHELPCGCPPGLKQIVNLRKPVALKVVITTALQMVITQFSNAVLCLSTPVCVLFSMLQDRCTEESVTTAHDSVGLQLLAWLLKLKLQDLTYIQKMVRLELHADVQQQLSLLADCVYHVVVHGKGRGVSTPRLAGKFVKMHKEWLTERVDTITTHLARYLPNTDVLEGATSSFSDKVFIALASSVMDTESGYQDLLTVYRLVFNNWKWLEEQLDISPALSHGSQPKRSQFSLDISQREEPDFNPVTEFNKIGDNFLDQNFIMSFPFNWSQILQSDLGLSEFGFKTLLYNRHEMQDGAYLEDSEKRPVEILKSVFEHEALELS